MINYGTIPGTVVTHYDWLQDSQYFNEPLLDLTRSPWSKIERSIMSSMGRTKSLAKKFVVIMFLEIKI